MTDEKATEITEATENDDGAHTEVQSRRDDVHPTTDYTDTRYDD